MRKKSKFMTMAIPAGLGVAFVALIIGSGALYNYGTQDSLTATVTGKERVCESGKDGECRWLVMTDKTSFENTDTMFHLKWDSTDLQGKIAVGETYTFDYYGWRIPFLSAYPNIIEVQ